MSDIPNNIERREEPRFKVVQGKTVQVAVERSANESKETILGELRNLSPGGAQICLAAYPQFAEVIQLRIVVPDASVNIDVTSEVCWIRPLGDDGCLVGCSFLLRLSEAVIERLATAGILDRRRHSRHAISVPAIARWELDSEGYSVLITDFSEGGFCMTSDRSGTVGAVVSVTIDTPDDKVAPISGRVCWREERDGQFCLGCSMKSSAGFEQLNDICSVSNVAQDETTPSPARTRDRFFVAAMWLFMFAGSTLMGLKVIGSWHLPPTASKPADAQYNTVGHVRLADADGEATSKTPRLVLHDKKTDAIKSDIVDSGQIDTQETVQLRAPRATNHLDTSDQVEPSPTSGSLIDETVTSDLAPRPRLPGNQDTLPGPHRYIDNHLMPHVAEIGQITSVPPTTSEPNADITKAKDATADGDRFYRDGDFDKALSAFQSAVEYDAQNALHYYLLAMTHYQLHQFQKADTALQNAIRLEKEWPIDDWGARLTRYQGRPRLWVEQQRAAASDGN